MKTCKEQILEYLKKNSEKISIYDFIHVLQHRKGGKYSYQTIYTVLKTLQLKGVIEFEKNTEKIRTRYFVKLIK